MCALSSGWYEYLLRPVHMQTTFYNPTCLGNWLSYCVLPYYALHFWPLRIQQCTWSRAREENLKPDSVVSYGVYGWLSCDQNGLKWELFFLAHPKSTLAAIEQWDNSVISVCNSREGTCLHRLVHGEDYGTSRSIRARWPSLEVIARHPN